MSDTTYEGSVYVITKSFSSISDVNGTARLILVTCGCGFHRNQI